MNLAELAANRRPIMLRPIAEREGAITEYRTILVSILREIQRETERSVLPAYRDAEPVIDGALVQDEAEWFAALEAVVAGAVSAAVAAVTRLFTRESASHAQRLSASIYQSTRIPVPVTVLTPLVQHERIMRVHIERNASLITSVGREAVGRIEQMVFAARMSPRAARPTVFALRREIREGLQISRRRADLIAADQLASLNSQLTVMRHGQVGIDRYQWQTRADGKVRDLHRFLRGNIYKHGEPTGAEGGLPPGGPIRCRCTMIPILPGQTNAIPTVAQQQRIEARNRAEQRRIASRTRRARRRAA